MGGYLLNELLNYSFGSLIFQRMVEMSKAGTIFGTDVLLFPTIYKRGPAVCLISEGKASSWKRKINVKYEPHINFSLCREK